LGYEYLISDTSTTTPGAPTSSSSLTGHQITGSFSRDLSQTTTAGISASYATRDQEASTGNTSFNRWNVSLFNNYVLADKLIVRGDMGVARLSTTGDVLLTSSSNISYWLGPAIFTLGVERGFSETFGQGQNFGVVKTSGVLGSIQYNFTPLVIGRLNGNYRENDFTGSGGGFGGRTDKTYTVGVVITYQVARWLTATLDASHSRADSNDAVSSFTENRVRAALNAIFY